MATATVREKRIGGDVPTNAAKEAIESGLPYTVNVTLEGTCDMLFHAWIPDAIEAKAKASKNSKAKKTDDIDTYVVRNSSGEICLPGVYLQRSIINAAKYRQDPRSPRKSAMDLYKAAIVCTTQLASLGKTTWDYEHKCRAVIQRNGINRVRPAFCTGWRATFDILVIQPEYVSPVDLRDVIGQAGRLIGVADFRPTYGRFAVVGWEVMSED